MLRQELPNKRHYWRARFFLVLSVLSLLSLVIGLFNYFKPLPKGLSVAGSETIVNLSDIAFLSDRRYERKGQTVTEQQIANTQLELIRQAEQYILLDMFLFNDQAKKTAVPRRLAAEVVQALLDKKAARPEIAIDVLVDPINTVYGAVANEDWQRLRAAGINLIEVDLRPLRDSNPLYSSPWRLLFSWFGTAGFGYLPNPFAATGPKVSLRAYLSMLNFKANHRKVLLADNQGRLVSVISSANLHGPSANHNNVALLVKGDFGLTVYQAEAAVAAMSGAALSELPNNLRQDKGLPANHYAKTKLLSENQIKAAMLSLINDLTAGDSLDVAMFYLSDRQVIAALKQAANRGVAIRLILDPNKDAFGYQKNGIPNRSVACELHRQANIDIRWYDTDGEQFHSKLIIAKQTGAKTVTAMLGSANVTKRNLAAYNLELDVLISTRSDLGLALQLDDYFQTLFYNRDDALYTVDYNRYADCSLTKTWLYRWQEFSGLASF